MKTSHYIVILFLALAFFISSARTSSAGNITGYLDCVTNGVITGWAWNQSEPDLHPPIRIVVSQPDTKTVFQEFTASSSIYREDLARLGYGNGDYGFSVSVDWSSFPQGVYQIDAYAEKEHLANTLHYNTGNHEYVHVSSAPGNVRSLGVFKATAYCPCRACCGNGGGKRTSSGTVPTAGRTISVDPRIIPYGTKLMINGNIYTAEDSGGGIKGNRLDIFFNSHSECLKYGVKKVEVFVVE